MLDSPLYNGGGYFKDASDAQRVLDAYHSGDASILRTTGNGNVVVRYRGVTGYNNNPGAGYLNQPTDVFMIKGTKSVSIVPSPQGVHGGSRSRIGVGEPRCTDGDAGTAWARIATLRGVAVEIHGAAVTIHFVVSNLSEAVEEDIYQVVGDVEGLLLPDEPEVRSRIFVGSPGPGWEGRHHRLVLLARISTLLPQKPRTTPRAR